ncbi:hypothetical protein [Sphaerisporangium perillae]|uniref:hypothetical protein n=1 Tax=Sphaerisporangium perillae TaxID=2935860 RepID=UPI00200D2FFF|nr:hypothetical protein [Sphaerisporangium perillae]
MGVLEGVAVGVGVGVVESVSVGLLDALAVFTTRLNLAGVAETPVAALGVQVYVRVGAGEPAVFVGPIRTTICCASICTVPVAVGVTATVGSVAGNGSVALGDTAAANEVDAVAVGVSDAIALPGVGRTTSSPSSQTNSPVGMPPAGIDTTGLGPGTTFTVIVTGWLGVGVGAEAARSTDTFPVPLPKQL